MKLSKLFWARLEDNIVAIVFLGIFQIWMTIVFPGHVFLGSVGNTIPQLIYLFLGSACLIWLFTFCNNLEDTLFLSNDSLKFEEPLRTYVRLLRIAIFVIIFTFTTYYGYRKGFFNYSKVYYVMMYANGALLYYFLYQAVQKRKNER